MAERALSRAAALFPDADVHLLHVIDLVEAGYSAPPGGGLSGYYEEWYETREERADDVLDDAETTLEQSGFEGTVERHVELGAPARTIVNVAEEESVDHVVMGSHGRTGASRILLGSVAETVVRRAPCPVTVVR